MKCFVKIKPSTGANFAFDDVGNLPSCLSGWDNAWDWVETFYLEKGQYLPSGAFTVEIEDEDGNRHTVKPHCSDKLDIAPAFWDILRLLFGANVAVVCGTENDDQHISAMRLNLGSIYLTGEDGEIIPIKNIYSSDPSFLNFFHLTDLIRQIQSLILAGAKPLIAMPTIPSAPIAPSGDVLSPDETARIVSVVRSRKWRKGSQANKKAGSRELWVGYAIAEAMGLDIDANQADRDKASDALNELLGNGVLSSYLDRDAKSNVRAYIRVNEIDAPSILS